MPRVTVMVPTYPGGEKYLQETLDSLQSQTYTDYKLSVVNDKRMDLPKYNDALDSCDTEYIAFPHHDDIYLPTWLEEMVKALDSNPTAVAAFCLDTFINADGGRIPGGTTIPIPKKAVYEYRDIVGGVLRFGNFLRCETVVFRRSAVGSLRYDTTGRFGKASDTAFWFTLLDKAGPICIVDSPLVRYRQHDAQGTQTQREANAPQDHVKAMEYAANLRPDEIDWDVMIGLYKGISHNRNLEDMAQVKAKTGGRVRLVVVHEPPDNAGTGVVAAHSVREANKRDGEIAYYVFADPNATHVQEGFFRGCPILGSPPAMLPSIVDRLKPFAIDYHHTLVWGDDILAIPTTAVKSLYLHDRWMWSEHPHEDGKFRDTRKFLEGVKVYGNSEWTCRVAREKLGVDVELFDAFVPLPHKPVAFRKRVGFFGGFGLTKGVHVLLQAARKLPDVLFVLFSQPPEEMMEGRRIYAHENVVVVGSYIRADMPLLCNLVDAVVVPSLFESFGLVKREVESLGIPVIASKVGGMDGTIAPNDVDALVEAIG